MKTAFILLLILSQTQAFNIDQCIEDIDGVLLSYGRAVIDWNLITRYRQALQEMGFALQFLGQALIDCNIFSVFSLEHAALKLAGEKLGNYDGPVDEFTDILTYTSTNTCEDKLTNIYENSIYFLETNKGVQHLMQSLYDLLTTCELSPV